MAATAEGDLRIVEAQPPSRAAELPSSSCTMKPGGERKRSRDFFLLSSNSHPYRGQHPSADQSEYLTRFLLNPRKLNIRYLVSSPS